MGTISVNARTRLALTVVSIVVAIEVMMVSICYHLTVQISDSKGLTTQQKAFWSVRCI
jgi:hypothetical protein